MKIYIGCAIQNLCETEYSLMLSKVNWLKNKFNAMGHEVLNFKSCINRDSTPEQVFEWDQQQCTSCDAMIALAIHPSIGLGMEVVYCLKNGAFVYATAPEGTNVSKMLLGCSDPKFKFRFFEEFSDIPTQFFRAYSKNKHKT